MGKEKKKLKTQSGTQASRCNFAYFFIQGLVCGSLSDGMFCLAVWPVACAVPQTIRHTVRSTYLGDRKSTCCMVKCKSSYLLENWTVGNFSEQRSWACTESRVTPSLGQSQPGRHAGWKPQTGNGWGTLNTVATSGWFFGENNVWKRKILLPDADFGSRSLNDVWASTLQRSTFDFLSFQRLAPTSRAGELSCQKRMHFGDWWCLPVEQNMSSNVNYLSPQDRFCSDRSSINMGASHPSKFTTGTRQSIFIYHNYKLLNQCGRKKPKQKYEGGLWVQGVAEENSLGPLGARYSRVMKFSWFSIL